MAGRNPKLARRAVIANVPNVLIVGATKSSRTAIFCEEGVMKILPRLLCPPGWLFQGGEVGGCLPTCWEDGNDYHLRLHLPVALHYHVALHYVGDRDDSHSQLAMRQRAFNP